MVDSRAELATSLFGAPVEIQSPKTEAQTMMAIMESFPVAVGEGGLGTILPSLETETLTRYLETADAILCDPQSLEISGWDQYKYQWVKMVQRMVATMLEQRQRTGFQPTQFDHTIRAAFGAVVQGSYVEAERFITELNGLDQDSLSESERSRLKSAGGTILKALGMATGKE